MYAHVWSVLTFQQSIYEKVHSMNFITGCALFFNMKALSTIGFFDEKILVSEVS